MRLTLTFIFSIMILLSWGQNQVDLSDLNTWETYFETNQIKIEYKVVDCEYNSDGLAQRNVLLKYVNKTPNKLDVSWSLDLYFDDKCKTCNSFNGEYDFNISLAPNSTYEGACNLKHRYDRKLFVRHINLENESILTNFQLSNLQVKEL